MGRPRRPEFIASPSPGSARRLAIASSMFERDDVEPVMSAFLCASVISISPGWVFSFVN